MARRKGQISSSIGNRNRVSIIRLSNQNQAENISPGMYYYVDMKTKQITFYDYRKTKRKREFNSFDEFDKFVEKNIEKDYK